PVVRTRVVLRHLDLIAFIRDDDHRATAQPRRRLDRVDQPRPLLRPDHDAVDHDLDVVLLVLVHRDLLADLVEAAVDPDADETRLADVVDQRPVLALPPFDRTP